MNNLIPYRTVDEATATKADPVLEFSQQFSQPTFNTSFVVEDAEGSIIKRFDEIAHNQPEQIAVQSAEQTLTYGELRQFANQLAYQIIEQVGEGTQPIMLLFDHTAQLIVSIIGVLKAGRAYVAMDPANALGRLTEQVDLLQTPLMVTSDTYAALATQISDTTPVILNLATSTEDISREQDPGIFLSPSQPAVLFFTSGSTGTPKAVARKQSALLYRVWFDTMEDELNPTDRISLLYQCSYAASVNSIFNALLNGAQLCLYDIHRNGVTGLAAWLRQSEITRLHIAAPLFRQFLYSLEKADFFPAMRQVVPASQQIYKSDVIRFWSHFPDTCKLISRFSASETGTICRMVVTPTTEIEGDVVPVGYPMPGKEVLILDEAGDPLEPGQIGEIAVRSHYLAAGYWNDAGLDQEKFRTDTTGHAPPLYRMGDWGRMRLDGCLEFLGRQDEMVKIRGYRVELGAVEAMLHTLKMVKAATVTAYHRPGKDETIGNSELVAYIVAHTQPTPTTSTLRTLLAANLPDYMMPSHFIFLDSLPLLPNGKVDRKALPAPQATRPTLDNPYLPPCTPWEECIVTIWQEVLGVNPVGVNDHFLDLGGSSLRAMQVHARLVNHFQHDLPARLLFECATVAEMALVLMQQAAKQLDEAELEQLLATVEESDVPEEVSV